MSVAGNWKLTMQTPFGVQTPTLVLREENGGYDGELDGASGKSELENLSVSGNDLSFDTQVATPMGKFKVGFSATVDGDTMSGKFKTMMGSTDFTGERQ